MKVHLWIAIGLVLGCGQGPVPVRDDGPASPPVSAPMPTGAQVPPVSGPVLPSRLALPAGVATVAGVQVPIGPLHDTVTGRSCYLNDRGLCVPTDTTVIDAGQDTAFVDVDCQSGVVRLPSSSSPDLFDGARVWTLIAGQPKIPDGTRAVAQRDSSGKCVPSRLVMAGGWGFATEQIASKIWAVVSGK